MRDGPSLTPLVMSALLFLPQAGAEGQTALSKGANYLAAFTGDDGRLKVQARELLFPVYTAASASRVLVLVNRSPRNVRAQQAWLAYLRGRQLNESLGWQPADAEYGGWGYALDVPRKPVAGRAKELLHESNLAATVFALAALRSAQVPLGDPAYAQALAFVKRCQNFSDDAAASDPKFDDGGFFFIPGDAAQNKAGTAGSDRFGHSRFHSYGTMTADGVRASCAAGLVQTIRGWLRRGTGSRGTFRRPTTRAHSRPTGMCFRTPRGTTGHGPPRTPFWPLTSGAVKPATGRSTGRRRSPVSCSRDSAPMALGSTVSPTLKRTTRWWPRRGPLRHWRLAAR